VANDLARAYFIAEIVDVYTLRANRFVALMPEGIAIALSKDPRVESVEQDVRVKSLGVQNNAPWNLDRTDQRDGGSALNQQFTWDFDGSGVDIYIMDSMVRTTHQDFGGRAAFTGICEAPPEVEPCDPNDPECVDIPPPGSGGGAPYADPPCSFACGHGTFVAGIAGGTSYGVAKGASLKTVGATNCTGDGFGGAIANAVDQVVARHQQSGRPSVLNISLHTKDAEMDDLDDAVVAAINSGITVVAAAGNDDNAPGETPYDYSPTRLGAVIVVGATTVTDSRWTYSNGGSNYGTALDLFAPGAGVVSTGTGSDADEAGPASGTSFAAPIVSGIAAMYLQANPSASPSQVRDAIVNNATPNKIPNPGAGSPNLIAFSDFIAAPPPPPPPSGPMFSNSAVRQCSNYVEWSPVYQPSASACHAYCESNGANACEWHEGGDCYVEFGSGCQVESGFPGWSAFVFNEGGPPPSSSMTEHTAVSGCSGWWWHSPVYKPDAESCGSHCQANGADACEWEVSTGNCYVEFGSGCSLVGHGGWWAAVYNDELGTGAGSGFVEQSAPQTLAYALLVLAALLAVAIGRVAWAAGRRPIAVG
jgi:hypothetical protein